MRFEAPISSSVSMALLPLAGAWLIGKHYPRATTTVHPLGNTKKNINTFQIEDIATQPWYIAGPAGNGHDYDETLLIQIEDIHRKS